MIDFDFGFTVVLGSRSFDITIMPFCWKLGRRIFNPEYVSRQSFELSFGPLHFYYSKPNPNFDPRVKAMR